MLNRTRAGAAAGFLMLASSAIAADSFHDLRVNYRCEVVGRLEQIHDSGEPSSDRDRFLAIAVPGHPHGYVQCIFHDEQSGLYCEAASGYWFDKEGAPRTFRQPPDAIAALARLGFNTDDSQGNFRIDLPLAAAPDFNGSPTSSCARCTTAMARAARQCCVSTRPSRRARRRPAFR